MTDPDFTGLPDHPSLEVTRAMGRALFTGLPEVIAMDSVWCVSEVIENQNRITPVELKIRWSQAGMYEGGIDYERPEPPSGADGLVVVEIKPE